MPPPFSSSRRWMKARRISDRGALKTVPRFARTVHLVNGTASRRKSARRQRACRYDFLAYPGNAATEQAHRPIAGAAGAARDRDPRFVARGVPGAPSARCHRDRSTGRRGRICCAARRNRIRAGGRATLGDGERSVLGWRSSPFVPKMTCWRRPSIRRCRYRCRCCQTSR